MPLSLKMYGCVVLAYVNQLVPRLIVFSQTYDMWLIYVQCVEKDIIACILSLNQTGPPQKVTVRI